MSSPRSYVPARPVARLLVWAVLLAAWCAQPGLAQQHEPSAEESFAEAFRLYDDGLYEQATLRFSAFREAFPEHVDVPEALYYEAEATLALGREEQAVELFGRFQTAYPNHPLGFQARLALGKYFYEHGDYGAALTELRAVLDEAPPADLAAKALYWMGESSQNLGRHEEAVRYFQEAADRYRETPTAPVALYAVGYTRVRQERFDDAARAFEVLAARYPESPYARDIGLALAEVYYELKDFNRAIQQIQRKLPDLQGETHERAQFMLAESYNQLRDSENAILYYRRLTEGEPTSPYYRPALYGLAWNYHLEGVYQWAADFFAQTRQGQDDDMAARATYYEAVNRKLDKKPDPAIDLLREFLDRWPEHELADHAQFELGVAYYELRMWREANEAFRRLVVTHPRSDLLGETLLLRGNTFVAQGDFDEALESFDRAVALDAAPVSLKREVVFQKAWLLYRNEQFAEAAPAFLELFEENPSGPKADEALFWAAESFFQTNQLDRAARLFRRYLQDFSGGDKVEAAHYALGWTYFKQGRYADAATSMERFLAAYRVGSESVPYRTDALLRLADSYYALKRYPEAIRTYARVAAEGEDYALYQIGQAYNNAGDTFEAISTFRRLLSEYPESTWREESLYTLGYLYFQNQDFDQAISTYQDLIRQYPRHALAAKAQYGVGDALFNAGRLEEAVDAYRTVLDRYPQSPFVSDAAAGIQYALVAMEDEERASAIVDSFATANPDSPVADELRFRQAEVQYQSGRIDAALADFQRFVRTSRSEKLLPEAYYYLGSIYADRNRVPEASSYFRQILDAYPQSPRRSDAARRLGTLLLEQREYEGARTVFAQLAGMNPDDARLVALGRYGEGLALLNLGRAREAESLLEEALRAAPDAPESTPALLGLARVYEETGRQSEAIQLYRQVVDRARDDVGAEALFHLGALLRERGDARRAVEELGRMPVLYAAYPEWVARSYLEQARAFEQMGERGEAVRLYELVINDFADTPHAATARREKDAL